IEASRQLALERNQRRLLEKFGHAARDILGARYSAIGVLDPSAQKLQSFFVSGLDVETAARLGLPPPRVGLLGRILALGRPIRIRDLTTTPEAESLLRHHPPVRSFLGVPVASPSQLYGVLCLTAKLGASEFSGEDEQIAFALAAQLAVVIENARRY